MKLLKMSNFTFSQSDFYAICILKSCNSHISGVACSFFEFGTVSKWCIREWVKILSFGKELTLYSIDTHFNASTRDIFLKTLWEKKKLLVTSNFFFFPQCFLLNQKIVSPFINIFDIISLFAAEMEEPKLGIEVKG